MQMTAEEKRREIIRRIEQVPENWLNTIDRLLVELSANQQSQAETKAEVQQEVFEQLLQQQLTKYKEVWKALA
jgi:predicted alternative tryptophan synthase beta-subunit